MSRTPVLYLFLLSCLTFWGQQTNTYEIRFDKAVHHEARIRAKFENLEKGELVLSMSRSSPGRYALHEFAKNVYAVSATDANGRRLIVERPNPYQWVIAGHGGTVIFEYTLFADHADGTYSQIDLTHAHLNMPATFIFAKGYEHRPVELRVHPREDLGWKVATQLKRSSANTFYAPNLNYFLDSPMEISDHQIRSFEIRSGGEDLWINFVLHELGKAESFDLYFEQVQKIVRQQEAIFNELPAFDYGEYTFLACYAPQVDGDGMEHRNSTVLTSSRPLDGGGLKTNIGTVAHEFFHAWNVERIRPASLEPFDFERANMSGELWFAEGFTSYYTGLTLCRSGLISREDYAKGLGTLISRVANAPGRRHYNPVEMSYQAPFVDAATSVDPVNRENTFISYYTYGNLLGLCLDLSLRNLEGDKNLDQFMQMAWKSFGKSEKAYTVKDLRQLLTAYTEQEFAQNFFDNYIWKSELPDLKALLGSVGIYLDQANLDMVFAGADIRSVKGGWLVSSNPLEGHSLYMAGLTRGDLIKSLGGESLAGKENSAQVLSQFSPGENTRVVFERHGREFEAELTWTADPSYISKLMPETDNKSMKRRDDWLKDKALK